MLPLNMGILILSSLIPMLEVPMYDFFNVVANNSYLWRDAPTAFPTSIRYLCKIVNIQPVSGLISAESTSIKYYYEPAYTFQVVASGHLECLFL